MLKILVVEDEVMVAEQTMESLSDLNYDPVGYARTLSHAEALIEEKKPDIVILDLDLAGLEDGLDLTAFLNDRKLPFIIASGNQNVANVRAGFERGAVWNLEKPFPLRDLKVAIEKVIAQLKKNEPQNATDKKDFFFVPISAKDKMSIIFSDIEYLDAGGNYCTIFMKDGTKQLVSWTLKDMMDKLPGTFFHRVSRSATININEIKQVRSDKSQVTMKSGIDLAIGGKYKDGIASKLAL
jgi:DNA-binding LytR/AlgR family response regulator